MKKEISLLKKLNHPNIVKYYQTDLSQDMYTIDVLLEYAPGGSLKNILGKYYPLEMEIIKTYSKQLLNALDYLHSNFIVHRDLKSANILISFSGELKLSDLGSSIALEDPEKGLGKSFKGSPYWMAPEVVLRQGHSYPADIWSFGCVLIEMVAGQPPWSNYSRETREVLCLISKEDQLPDIPNTIPELRSVIIACLNRTPNLRPTTKTLISMPFFQTVFNNI
jgi:serine/threonine protein kinase